MPMPAKPLPPAVLSALRDYVSPRSGRRSLLWLGSPFNRDWPSEKTLHQAVAGRPVSDAVRAQIEVGIRKHAPHLLGADDGPDIIHALRRKAREAGFESLTDEQLLAVYRNVEPLLHYQFSRFV